MDGLEPEEWLRRPSEGGWSPAEIVEHVFSSEAHILHGIERQLEPNGERRELGKPSTIKFLALIGALRSPLKFKVPPGAAAMEPSGMEYQVIRENWSGFDAAWDSVFVSFPSALKYVGLIRHPVIGPMTFGQSLKFLIAHSARHYRQLERTVSLIQD